MTEHKTFPGKVYTVSCAEDTTVVLPDPLGVKEAVVLECTAGQQLHVTATAGRLETSSDQAIVTEVFKAAPGANVPLGAIKDALKAASDATAAADRAEQAAELADTDSVKRDLFPVAVSGLRSIFEQELGVENFALSLAEDESVLSVSLPRETEQTLRERLLGMCDRVCPAGVTVESWLPLGFTELEYLKSSGTQYIDTGIVTDGTYTIGVKYTPTKAAQQWICGRISVRFSVKEGGDSAIYHYFSETTERNDQNTTLCTAVRIWAAPKEGATPLATRDVVWKEGQQQIEVNGKTLDGIPTNELNVSAINLDKLTYFLFLANYPGVTMPYGSVILHGFRAWDADGVCVVDLCPVLDADGVPCMYDRVSGSCFYTPEGTGTFGYRVKVSGDVSAPMSLRDPYYTAPSGVYARAAGENELEIIADTVEPQGEGWVHFANTAEAYEHFGIK